MSTERAVIYVESGTSLRASSSDKNLMSTHSHPQQVGVEGGGGGGSNYVIKIQIGEETMFNPVRIDVSAGKVSSRSIVSLAKNNNKEGIVSSGCPCEESSSSGQSSPRSDMTPPPRININSGGGNRFGSETSESDTESDISAEFRPLSCPAAQFAMREIICQNGTPSPPLPRSSPRNKSIPPPLPTSKIPAPPSTTVTVYGQDSLKIKSSPVPQQQPQQQHSNILGAIMTLSESMALKRAKAEKENLDKKKILVDQSGFHVNEIHAFSGIMNNCKGVTNDKEESLSNFAGYRDIFSRREASGTRQILSDKGTIRGVKNRVRDGIATFLQSKDTKTYSEKEQGRVVVYTTSMGVVRTTFQRCQKVKQILRNLLVKFDERDCYMNRAIQNEIRQRLPQQMLALPQIFLEGQLLGDAEVIEKLNETGELRDLLKPYKSLSVLNTCERCGGFRMLPCPICNGSKKSVHRNHFTTEFIALKCMHCDPSGLVRCDLCNAPDS